MSAALIVFVTVPSHDDGQRIAEVLVGERLAACVNMIGPVRSTYRWRGEVCREEEHLLLIKTTPEGFDALEARVRALHSYEVPEVIAVTVDAGSTPYVEWVRAMVGCGSG